MKRLIIFFVIGASLFSLYLVSCPHYGGKVNFIDAEYPRGYLSSERHIYFEKRSVSGLLFRMYIGAYNSSRSFFSDASPYGFYIFLQPIERGNYDPEYYRHYTIKDVKITGSSGRDYTAIANTIFPITARLITNKEILAHNQHILGKYRTRNVFPFSYEELCMEFTFEIETIDAIESKQIKLTFSPEINWPEPIWQTMAR